MQHLSVGDRVVSACGRTLAERVVAKAGLVIPAPRALDFPSAAISHRGYVLAGGEKRFEDTGENLVNNEDVGRLYLGGEG